MHDLRPGWEIAAEIRPTQEEQNSYEGRHKWMVAAGERIEADRRAVWKAAMLRAAKVARERQGVAKDGYAFDSWRLHICELERLAEEVPDA